MNQVIEAQTLWRRLDQPGHDHCRLWDNGDAFVLTGTAIFADGGAPCRLDYQVFCDHRWRTRSGSVAGWCGGKEVRLEILALGQQRWQLNGAEVPEVHGCVDLDLGFTPATNLLSLRRLALEVGGEAQVRAAWLELPQFAMQPLEQLYRRTSVDRYHYESASAAYRGELRVSNAGFVLDYPGLWTVEAGGAAAPVAATRR